MGAITTAVVKSCVLGNSLPVLMVGCCVIVGLEVGVGFGLALWNGGVRI